MDDLEIAKVSDDAKTRNHRPHPWWSRLLYLAYGIFAGVCAAMAVKAGEPGLAIVAGGIGAVLVWKSSQRVR